MKFIIVSSTHFFHWQFFFLIVQVRSLFVFPHSFYPVLGCNNLIVLYNHGCYKTVQGQGTTGTIQTRGDTFVAFSPADQV